MLPGASPCIPTRRFEFRWGSRVFSMHRRVAPAPVRGKHDISPTKRVPDGWGSPTSDAASKQMLYGASHVFAKTNLALFHAVDAAAEAYGLPPPQQGHDVIRSQRAKSASTGRRPRSHKHAAPHAVTTPHRGYSDGPGVDAALSKTTVSPQRSGSPVPALPIKQAISVAGVSLCAWLTLLLTFGVLLTPTELLRQEPTVFFKSKSSAAIVSAPPAVDKEADEVLVMPDRPTRRRHHAPSTVVGAQQQHMMHQQQSQPVVVNDALEMVSPSIASSASVAGRLRSPIKAETTAIGFLADALEFIVDRDDVINQPAPTISLCINIEGYTRDLGTASMPAAASLAQLRELFASNVHLPRFFAFVKDDQVHCCGLRGSGLLMRELTVCLVNLW